MDEYRPLPDAPPWFTKALEVPQTDLDLTVDGCAIHALLSGTPGSPGLVFVHGGGAHAHWWTHISAALSSRFRVAAVDLSGHGDSGHRARYTLEQWADEVTAVAEASEFDGQPVLIGHSMGGMVVVTAAARNGRVAGTIVCDSPINEDDTELVPSQVREVPRQPRPYPSEEEAVRRFRPLPDPGDSLDFVFDHVARRSVIPTEGGWTWKFDQSLVEAWRGDPMRKGAVPYLGQVDCPFGVVRTEYGLVTEEIGRSMGALVGRPTPVVEIPEAGHHPMLDQPLSLITVLRAILAFWEEPGTVSGRD
jgi:pimeloyl-ACP methyl ester carboxylesterase